MKSFIGVQYGRGATATLVTQGPALAPKKVKEMYPDANWHMVTVPELDEELWGKDRFGENFEVQKAIVKETPTNSHILIGGDHSVNFGHFSALANQLPNEDLCLIYIDAHLDIHTPESSKAEASGAPHGTNVRALLGNGDSRWLTLQQKKSTLKPENLFYIGSRSYEPSEISFVKGNNVYMREAKDIPDERAWQKVVTEIKNKIGDKKYIISFDFDAIDPEIFKDVLVPEKDGISLEAAEYFIKEFSPNAHGIEFVEYSPTGDKKSSDIVKHLIDICLKN